MPRPKTVKEKPVTTFPQTMILKIHLKKLLEERNITQRMFSEMTGIRYGTVCDLCIGQVNFIKFEYVTLICQVLDITLDRLMTTEFIDQERVVEGTILPMYSGGKRIN